MPSMILQHIEDNGHTAYGAGQNALRADIVGGVGYDPAADAHRITSMQAKRRVAFGGAALSADWVVSLAPGAAAQVSGGALAFASGTTASAESTLLLPLPRMTVPFRMCLGLSLSQRIANQQFFVEVVGISADGAVDGGETAGWLFDGTGAASAKYRVRGCGLAALDSAASTVASTASAQVYEIEVTPDETWFHQRALDSAAARAYSYVRSQGCPDPGRLYALRLRWLNGATPPASSTTATVLYAALADYAELTAEITAGRGAAAAAGGQAVPVVLTADPSVLPKQGLWWQESLAELAAGAIFTGSARDMGCGPGNTNSYSSFKVLVFSDVACTLQIEIAEETGTTPATWRQVYQAAIAAGVAGYHSVPVLARHHRVKVVNGGTAQSVFVCHSGYFRTA